jgi:hypothetical protein
MSGRLWAAPARHKDKAIATAVLSRTDRDNIPRKIADYNKILAPFLSDLSLNMA